MRRITARRPPDSLGVEGVFFPFSKIFVGDVERFAVADSHHYRR